MTICALDVDYNNVPARAAAVVFDEWASSKARSTYLAHIPDVAPYEPGAFFKRELPCLLAVLAMVKERLDLIIVDSYVTLDSAGMPGLGYRLHEALDGRIPVVGVAKTAFHGSTHATEVVRNGAKPLYVTQVGYDPLDASRGVERMHGRYRLPERLKEVDHLARGLA